MQLALRTTATCDDACDEIVRDVLEELSLGAPPVDALYVADRLQLAVVYDAAQAGRARIKRLCGQAAIFLKPDERPERVQWATAHEVGESLAHRVLETMGVDPADLSDELEAAQREHIANEFASRLLLPTDWFLADAEELDGDLARLKPLYATASHELILTNLLRLPGLSLTTVFDHGRMTRRRGNGQLAPPRLMPVEQEAWRRAHATGLPSELRTAEVRVQAWAVHEAGWKRELLRTTPGEELLEPTDDF
jgi:hypothetical protein